MMIPLSQYIGCGDRGNACDVYIGEWKNGKPFGIGEFIYYDKEEGPRYKNTFQGTFEEIQKKLREGYFY